MWIRPSRFNGSDFILTDEQKKRGQDIEIRAQPIFYELNRVEEQIRHLRQKLYDAQDKKKRLEAHLAILSDEKSAWWEEIFAAKKNTKGG